MDAADQLEVVARVLLAAVLGALIGIERELRDHPAGVRTLTLVALGAALFTDISRVTGVEDRIAAGIVTGVGFLGAGVIFRQGQTVEGITTAATIWAAAAIGMAVGFEMYLVAPVTTAVVVAVLEARPLAQRLEDAAVARGRAPRHRLRRDSKREGND